MMAFVQYLESFSNRYARHCRTYKASKNTVTSIGTSSVQNSEVSFGLSLPFVNCVDVSDFVVVSIGPAVGIGQSSLDSVFGTVVTSVIVLTSKKVF